ncbi:acetyltransferase [Flavobacterium psychrophilum]|uniref:acetyltransferase n=1 Tax=Flavobacterium psychrophilum TaxID=96345 RepID=UPI000B7C29E0|nr:acetyltransferase [Flavobacterium psychrophilum]EKT4525830.1 acetyltransferase [Flavobacterium psychrophilum]SNA68295.1 putative lipopolysaccharide biosynthesis O-acetyl transferase [Flavobacterium psychrophilum]
MLEIYKIYSFFGFIRLLRDKLYTLLFFRNARIVRLPIYIRGRKGIFGYENLTLGINLRVDIIESEGKKPKLIIGKNVQINDYVHIGVANEVVIGDNTLIASKVFISDHNHGLYKGKGQSYPNENPILRVIDAKKISIGSNVWIGEFVCVLPGVTIGNGSIIGAMSVVTKDIPANCIAVGSPARIIKSFDNGIKEWV